MAYGHLLNQAKKISEILFHTHQRDLNLQLIEFRADLLALTDENQNLREELNRLKKRNSTK